MNKTELISAMAERSGLSKKDTEKALTAALETIAAALAAGDRVQLVGFGTFDYITYNYDDEAWDAYAAANTLVY